MSHTLSSTAAVAIATYGVILHTGAAARREFCVAFVGECVESGASVDDVSNAAKVTVDYDGMEDAERALFRKQVQYCRAIVGGWKALGVANQRAFVGGSLPASSAVKLLKPKAAPATAPATAPASDSVNVSQPETETETATAPATGAEVISPAEMGVRFGAWLDSANPAKLTKAEAKAVASAFAAMDAFRNKVADAAKAPARKAA